MSADVKLLRDAAALMRERANAASEGPWETGGDGLVWPPRIGDPVSGSTDIEDAEHIASWDPVVALAVADWLDYAAGVLEHLEQRGHKPTDNGYTSRAQAVARAYLGRAES